jgi:hypothetical protein
MENELSGPAFAALSPPERVSLCRRMADQASALAKGASPNFRAAYTILAIEWLMLADEIARATMGAM